MRDPRPEEIELKWLLIVGVFVSVLLAMSIVFFVLFYQRKLIKYKIREKQKEFDYQKKLLIAHVETQEAERDRISRDLHDDVGGYLSSLKLFISGIAKSNNLPATIEHIQTILAETTHRLRTISYNISPKPVQELGLVVMIFNYCRTIQEASKLKINFASPLKKRFAVEQEIHVYRIVQELITNTLKHAEASVIDIILEISSNEVCLTYQDDGIGMNIPEMRKREKLSLGISNIESRAKAIKARLELTSSFYKGFGATLNFKPLPYEEV